MDIDWLFRRDHSDLVPYTPVLPPESLAKLGNVQVADVIKLNANENPYGPSPRVKAALGSYNGYNIYPDPDQSSIRALLAEYVGVPSDYIIAGSGADEIIDLVLRATIDPGDTVIDCPPTFGMYSFSTNVNGGSIISIPRNSEFNIDISSVHKNIRDNTKVIFVTSPNNPTGNIISESDINELLQYGRLVVLDEAYSEFSGSTLVSLVHRNPNLIVLRTASKWCGLAGLRLGYGIMDPKILQKLMSIKQPYNINTAAEIALAASLEDLVLLKENVEKIVAERIRLFDKLSSMDNVTPYPSHGNFILCSFSGIGARDVYEAMASSGIFVRYFNVPELRDYIRISIGRPEHMDKLVDCLTNILGQTI